MPLPSPVADFPDMSGFIDQSRARASSLMNAAWSQLSGMGQQSAPANGAYGPEISGYGQETPEAMTGGSHPTAPAGTPGYIRYANQGAIRNGDLSPEMTQAMGFLEDMGITMEVFSGGQPSAAEGGARVGSTRHDHGQSADVFFYRGDEMLNWQNQEHVPVFQDIVRRARSNGLTGFGAGDGYMRPGSMHIGYGAPAVWGAGGSGSSAPDWLRNI